MRRGETSPASPHPSGAFQTALCPFPSPSPAGEELPPFLKAKLRKSFLVSNSSPLCCMVGQNQKASLPQSGAVGVWPASPQEGGWGAFFLNPLLQPWRQPPPLVSFLPLGRFLLHLTVPVHVAVQFCLLGSPISPEKPEAPSALDRILIESCGILVPKGVGEGGGAPAGPQSRAAGFQPNSALLEVPILASATIFGVTASPLAKLVGLCTPSATPTRSCGLTSCLATPSPPSSLFPVRILI